TAPLPGTPPSNPVISTTNSTSPFTTSTLVNNSGLQELVTLSGSIRSEIQTLRYGDTCPAVTYNTHVNLLGVSGLGPLSDTLHPAVGASSGKARSLIRGTFAFPGTFRLTPANPQVASTPIQVQSFVTLDANGVATNTTTPPADLVSWWMAENNAADA